MRVARALVGFVLAAYPFPVSAEEFKLVPSVSEVQLGDPFDVYLQASSSGFKADAIAKVQFNADFDRWHIVQDWRPVPPRPATSQGNQKPDGIWRSTLQAFDVGDLSLPETHVFTRNSGTSETLSDVLATTETIKVVGLRKENENSPKLAGFKPVYRFPMGWGMVPLPPSQWALRELDRLKALPVCSSGPAKAIDSLAADLIRMYLQRRYQFAAMDMTTYECLAHLRDKLVSKHEEMLRVFLNECDLVKFSKFEPPRERWESIWNDARDLILATTPHEELTTDIKLESASPVNQEGVKS
ncbi:hypothetical protein HY256_02195 [Candidatus Sumerlaeota bacterium]|nr:hypothetical protein [Candidatus Sumerlaeota bacterium]